MDLDWFKNLASLARTGNFSQAAELNHISQSAFSRRIRALESWVGTPLVDRSVHPVKLTPAGRQILEAGEQAISRIETERAHIRDSLEQPDKYVVSFGAQHSIGWRFFPTWLQAFEERYGPIISRLQADDLPNCLAGLKKGELDFVVSYESANATRIPAPGTIQSLMIGRDRLVPVSRPTPNGSPLFDIDADPPQPLPYLKFGPTAPIGRHIDPLLKTAALESRLETVYENSMAGALRIRARDGLGLAWLPHSLVEPDLSAGLLVLASHAPTLSIDLDVCLNRLTSNKNSLIGKIWDFLVAQDGIPLV